MKTWIFAILSLLIFYLSGCMQQRTLDKYEKTIKQLDELVAHPMIDSSQLEKLTAVVEDLIDIKISLEEYNFESDDVQKLHEEQNKVDLALQNINERLSELIAVRDQFEVKRKLIESDTFRRKCLTDYPKGVKSIGIPRYNRATRAIFANQMSKISIYFHILQHSDGRGNIQNLENTLRVQIDSLNLHFAGANIVFVLEGYKIYNGDQENKIDRYFLYSLALESDENPIADSMSAELAITPEKVLNVYSLYSGDAAGSLGKASLPFPEIVNTVFDYVFIAHETLPGQPVRKYQYDGKTLTHEIGHYLGLLHVFEMNSYCWEMAGKPKCYLSYHNGCGMCYINGEQFFNGDFIMDTPPQAKCYFDDECCSLPCRDCDNMRDILSSNFMGYNEDACMRKFTEQQLQRMNEKIYEFRRHYIERSVVNPE